MKRSATLLLMLGALALSSCSSREAVVELPGGVLPSEDPNARQPSRLERMFGMDDRPNVGPCPLMGVLYDNARVVAFTPGGGQRYASIQYTGEMQAVRGLCRYIDEDPITMSIEVDMAFGRGPASTSNRQTYRYWVAVTRRGFAPIAKEYFDVEVRWRGDEAVATVTEEINTIVIPRADADTSGENFEVLVGFELTPEQLQFNRDGRRFRIDAASRAVPGQ
jgi:hypothetical protein